jgi:hypothetical protein
MVSGTRQDNTLYVGRYAESLGLRLPCSDEFSMNRATSSRLMLLRKAGA